jgi:hypothetical protein
MNKSQIKNGFGGSLLLLTFLYSLALGFGQNSNYFEDSSSEIQEDIVENLKENTSSSEYHFQGGKGNTSAVFANTTRLAKCASAPFVCALASNQHCTVSEAPLYILYCSLKLYS